MKLRLSYTFGLIVLGVVAFAASPAGAATAAGPYYATPSWDQKLDCTTTANCPRFIVLSNWGNAAVLDRETGLVWEQSPSTLLAFSWFTASFQAGCIQLNAGGRTGWRLPTIQELLSLVDRSVSPGPTLPSGHPFSNVQSSDYWSATSSAFSGAGFALAVDFSNGFVDDVDKSGNLFRWCVRGGQGPDAQ